MIAKVLKSPFVVLACLGSGIWVIRRSSFELLGSIRWPGKIKPGQTNIALMTTMDLLPTFAILAGGDVPSDATEPNGNLFVLVDEWLKVCEIISAAL